MKTYITTPIYYVNDKAHIGHAYTTIIADTLARFARLKGDETFFLTGTDEHGQKIEESAIKNNESPKAYADKVSKSFKDLWAELEISNDYFIRTTDENHKNCVRKIFLKMYEKGDIYKDEYEGHYCVSCETFHTKTQLLDNDKCPDCKKPTRILKEESYFFRLSKYQDRLLKWYEDNPTCIMPASKKNEVIAFVKQGLRDLSVTRTSFSWGIKIPDELNDSKHIVYVWLDALSNYLSALGYLDNDEKMSFWPANIQLVGKDILKFHAIYWPCFLMSLDLELPKMIGAHGWWTVEGEKMSKSVGNVINPIDVKNEFGNEPLRYFLLSQMPFGNDGDFSKLATVNKINAELVNELGNLLSRSISMAKKYFDLKVEFESGFSEELNKANEYFKASINAINELRMNEYISEIMKALSIANAMVSKYEPWTMMKNNESKQTQSLLAVIFNILKNASILLSPVMPKASTKIANALGVNIDTKTYNDMFNLQKEFNLNECEHLFSRVELKIESKEEVKKELKEPKIKIDDFAKIKMQVATVLECENVEGSEKLLKFQLDLGTEKRQVLSGIAKYYNAKDLVGKQIILLANLESRKVFKHLSEGMILSAKNSDESLVLLTPLTKCENGAVIG
ncbi:methionine--tRNA ligase [Campylobacter sp. RM12640]|uniref:methionine--tRNA ligase n=1 Tax=unclassified Campylobacter TaxID=2593542 RepID=UPI0030143871|nr:methionine--tRNA ligase [Campylobacter sp. RM12640]MBZ7988863.1 methionine--tRNA ligase [Campylobacter sp. RM12635]